MRGRTHPRARGARGAVPRSVAAVPVLAPGVPLYVETYYGRVPGADVLERSCASLRAPMVDTPRTFLDHRAPTGWDAQPEPEQPQPHADQLARAGGKPLDALSTALLTDMYQITMAYSYWFNERHNGMLFLSLLCPWVAGAG